MARWVPSWWLKAVSAGNWVEIGARQQNLYHLMCMNVMTSVAEARRIPTCGPHTSDSLMHLIDRSHEHSMPLWVTNRPQIELKLLVRLVE
jgi:hypothetical protein